MRQMALAMDFQKDSTAELEKSRNKIIRISERAMRQVNDLTKIARLEEGLFTLEPVSIRAVCDDVISELEQLFALNQRKLRFEYRNKARLVIGNYDLIFSVIYNFCANAMYYSTVETESCLIISDKKDKVTYARLVGIRSSGCMHLEYAEDGLIMLSINPGHRNYKTALVKDTIESIIIVLSIAKKDQKPQKVKR